MDWFDTILWPLKVAVAWIMVQFHTLLTAAGLESDSGAAWGLSIVGLVIVIRILLIPLFVKQIKASRGMQLLAPEMQAIQKKYKGKTDPASREAMSRETMELYRKHGTNPFSSCLPILAQSPIFFALFRVLYSLGDLADGTYADGTRTSIGPLTQELAGEANAATIFGAPISSFFLQEGASSATRIVSVVLIIAMSLTTFTTQRQLTQKNMPASALQGPMAQQQKMLLYILPLVFAISGVNFPIGVLIYWTTTNLWSMGQQFYVIRRNPTPGSQAEIALKERRARKAAARGIVLEEERPAVEPPKPTGQRQQPKRNQRRPAGSKPAAAGTAKPAGAGATKPAGAGSGTKKPRPTQGAPSSAAADGSSGAAGATADGTPSAVTPAKKKRPAGTSASGSTRPAGSAPRKRPPGSTPPAGRPTEPAAAPADGVQDDVVLESPSADRDADGGSTSGGATTPAPTK